MIRKILKSSDRQPEGKQYFEKYDLVSGEKEEREFALNHRAEKLFFRLLSHTYKIFF